MFSAFQTFGRLGAGARAVAAAWSPSALWPTGTEPGMWIDPSNLTSQWQDSIGTTPVATPGTVADSSNPVGLALDLRLGATVLTDPGNHLLQATSTARPLLSARVNLLTYTEDFSHTWDWSNGDIATTSKLAAAANSSAHGVRSIFPAMNNPQFTVRASAAEYGFLHLVSGPGISPDDGVSYCATFDLVNGTVIKDGSWGTSAQIVAVGGGLYDCSVVSVHTECVGAVICYGPTADTNTYLGDGVSGVNVFRAQISYQDTPYQSVPGDGSTYPSTGFPIYQKYDGTDDGMATASFAAGTLTNAMDCMIAVRRDSAANTVCGLYESVSDANKVFGIAESGSGSGCVGSGAGTPTVWVDGAQLTGGTAVTRGTLHTALSAGDWHILELRGLDLSTWTAAGSGLYTSYVLNGGQGGILLFPSSTSTADRDAARTWLGAKVGLTL